jgi:2-polyprenyl-3-methyl-5-hydroxy-6-metoxy-1,4-benzoquinol methylase
MASDMRAIWDAEAGAFDDEPDHGLLDPTVRAAWRQVLLGVLPPSPARILDLGCGTGSLSVLCAEMGHAVTGIDLSTRMIERAETKARRHAVDVDLRVGDAASPQVSGAFDVVLTRHLLWALPEPGAAVARWADLLTGDGRLVLIEGRWHTGAGLAAAEVLALVLPHTAHARVQVLDDAALWGAPIADERYLILATR